MLWYALPPEINVARLMVGAGPAPMLAAAAGWEALSAAMDAQSIELLARLNSLGEVWTGESSERAIDAAKPMVGWLQTASEQAKTRAAQATAQAAAYTQAMTSMPTLIEIAANHITEAILVATNFLGINIVPIAFTEADYFIRMWTQAALAMDAYQAETLLNTAFQKLEPMAAILNPAGNQSLSSAMTCGMNQFSQMTSSFPSALPPTQAVQQTVGQVAELAGQMQQLTQPVQQVTSLFSSTGSTSSSTNSHLGNTESPQIGLLGASPLSNHPLAGGTGPTTGAGLLRAELLPGAGGSLARTPLLAELIDKPTAPAPVATPSAGAGAAATGGAAPIGVGSLNHGTQAGGTTRTALIAPTQQSEVLDENDLEDWDDDKDDW
ncbi:PPE family protein [Mycobacterium uberis]|uniref:PPE family protein n=1 Tax=Mycobacterium uberis TaxID=2162698 RepID=A0A3E1HLC2_9MYCO|nr:PPE family protein [Mycobacterium uberis]RFD27196.1 PPE family protein [Mycobacterium uberis]